jgi:hypothetical protein
MFRSVSEKLNHIARVASAATRPRANGRVDLIPKNILTAAEEYEQSKQDSRELRMRFGDLKREGMKLNRRSPSVRRRGRRLMSLRISKGNTKQF